MKYVSKLFDYPQQMFLVRNKKNIFFLLMTHFYVGPRIMNTNIASDEKSYKG